MTANPLSSPWHSAWEEMESTQSFLEPPKSNYTADSPDHTRLVLMSDTHGKHRQVQLPAGDVLIHAGDFTKLGESHSVSDLCRLFQTCGFEEVICIAGNHDISFHTSFYERTWDRFQPDKINYAQVQRTLKESCTYLEDSAYQTRKGNLIVYGSPWTPEFFDWAFNLPRGEPLLKKWQQIPTETDILITHGPPLGRGDLTLKSGRVGCLDLLQEVQERVKPRVHIFGHIHEDPGVSFDGQTLYCNAANCDLTYKARQSCIVVDVPRDRSEPALLVENP